MKINIKDLNEGIHEFHEEVPANELGLTDSDLYTHPLSLDLYIDRLENIYRIKVGIATHVRFSCDRCLEKFDQKFTESAEQIFQVGSGKLDDDDEVEILPIDTREIEIDRWIQDVFLMSRPIKLLCKPSCRGLCTRCGENLNIKQCTCDTDNIDPRLEKLKSLLK